jgi:hypothetical protein
VVKSFLNRHLALGTRSVLYGAHAFWLHPAFVALAWTLLYGIPWDPRLWVAFFVHDLGYIGKVRMDDEEGEKHVELGARIMHILFDRPMFVIKNDEDWAEKQWHNFTGYHSRFYAKRDGQPFSKLCVADKFAFCLTPKWLYLPMVRATGEIHEYLALSAASNQHSKYSSMCISVDSHDAWFDGLKRYLTGWVFEHMESGVDTWTNLEERNQ